ncbi:hypothetical protein EYF80_015214 [Liparis tanakae]|uniref:Secreted protein n=1 Tax=Liparis tanakae TaxID=230148 RepID=A0A4Z2I9Q0_9TELE|nr:hypothetical protein EYF80_015214 [Liparis tanakae]
MVWDMVVVVVVVVVGAKSSRCHGQRMPACGCDTKELGTNTPYDRRQTKHPGIVPGETNGRKRWRKQVINMERAKGAICIRGPEVDVERPGGGNKGSRARGEKEKWLMEDLGRRREDHRGEALSC